VEGAGVNEYQGFLVQTLRTGLNEIVTLAGAFPPSSLDHDWKRGEWSVRRHAHHLRQTEQRYVDRLEWSLEGSDRIPEPVQQLPPSAAESVESMLAGYADARRRALAIFEQLTEEQWKKVFNHPTIWGDVTLEWWAERFVQHTAEHLDELWMLKQLAGLTPEAHARVSATRTA
jgi:uncharacterized damage-inducible protein DinB